MASRKPDPLNFLKKFARILKNSEIKAFQWSDDGRYVIVHWKHFEACKGEHRKALSIFRRVKDRSSLRRLLGCHGFKKMGRRSSSDIIFEHPDFVRQEGDKKRSKPLETDAHNLGIIEDRSPTTSSDVLADMCFSPIKRRNARSLYQYINYNYSEPAAEAHNPPQQNPPPAKFLCASKSVDEDQIPEELDPGNSTANDAETDTECFKQENRCIVHRTTCS
ncbi:hypothetical protein ACEWY4_011426 [Coilia grayii]|uniref:HSF-type DNA-binding domain-containing protein n=1 Tax=Coilia grayii TaxID=363190 RepID=A0ABD1K4T9_9TELE